MSSDDDWYRRQQLHIAAGEGDLTRVMELVGLGHPINAFDDLSWTPLHHAAKCNHVEVVRYLIQAGADVNAHEVERIGDTVLKKVAESCSWEMARILVDAGADRTIPGWMGLTALDKSKPRKRAERREVHKLLCAAAMRCNPGWPRLRSMIGEEKKKK
jgi:ankyrin repeat protein